MTNTPILRRVTGTFGAYVENVDLQQPLDHNTVACLNEALTTYKVLLFRDQEITSEQQIKFGSNFAPVLDVHPWSIRKDGYDKIMEIKGAATGWHSDETWRAETPIASILLCRVAPDYGGDTCFADMERCYADLPQADKDRIENLVAIHDHVSHRARMVRMGVSNDQIEKWKLEWPEVEHPVVRTHPISGRKSIFVNAAFTSRIKGMAPEDSTKTLRWLYSTVNNPHYQIRFNWQPNSIAFWDNRSVQHYGVADYDAQVRHMERITLAGDRPFYRN